MAKMLKKSLAEKSLEDKAEENVRVTKGTKNEQKTLKDGVPNDHHVKQNASRVVGVSIGVTKNMGEYESLRVDCWLTDTIKDTETVESAYERVVAVVDKVLQNTVYIYTN